MVSAYSIGTAKRSSEQKNQTRFVPGPGAYDPVKKNKITPPSWRIGTGSRSSLLGRNTPGPGTYLIPAKITKEGPKYPFGVKISLSNKQKVPGPGTYEDYYRKIVKGTPYYSFGLKGSSQSRLLSPGPGAYDPNKTSSVIDVPSTRFTRALRSGISNRSNSPGVGTYKMSFEREGPKFGFGTSCRQFMINKTAPGPGTYELSKSLINPAHGVTMISRRNDASFMSAKNVPGPFEYNPDKLHSKANIRFGTSNREGSRSRSNTPGPGAYHPGFLDKPAAAKFRVGTSLRRPLSASNNYPGPGNYQIPSKLVEGPRHSMSGRSDQRNGSRSPGPGTYSPEVSLIKERAASPKIGSSNRPNFLLSKANPGPGQYDIRGGIMGPKWGFGSSMRSNLTSGEGVPGPATYNIPPTFADVPKYLINYATKA